MSEISTNIILDGITLALRREFPESQIYGEAVRQGLRAPAFIVLLVSADQKELPGGRWRRRTGFDILYFPSRGRTECHEAAERLSGCLRVIRLPGGDALRAADPHFTVDEGVLHFLVSYNYFVYQRAAGTPMGALELKQGGM